MTREPIVRELVRAVMITPGRADLGSALAAAEGALEGGVGLIQVREPHLGARELLAWGRELRRCAGRRACRILVNARVDVAAGDEYDGVHLSWRAIAPHAARELLGAEKWIGVSIHAPAEAADLARLDPCDYAIFGPVFATPSKTGLVSARGVPALREAARLCPRPLVAIGGIDAAHLGAERLGDLASSGAAGGAAIRAFETPALAANTARALREAFA